MKTLKTQITPNFLEKWASENQVKETIFYATGVKEINIISNNCAAYGCPAYQLIVVSDEDALKIENQK